MPYVDVVVQDDNAAYTRYSKNQSRTVGGA